MELLRNAQRSNVSIALPTTPHTGSDSAGLRHGPRDASGTQRMWAQTLPQFSRPSAPTSGELIHRPASGRPLYPGPLLTLVDQYVVKPEELVEFGGYWLARTSAGDWRLVLDDR